MEEIEKHVDAAMGKVQLLTELFGADINTSLCTDAIKYIVDGIGHDLSCIYEALDDAKRG